MREFKGGTDPGLVVLGEAWARDRRAVWGGQFSGQLSSASILCPSCLRGG